MRRRAPPWLILEVNIGQRLALVIPHDEEGRRSPSSTDQGGGKRRFKTRGRCRSVVNTFDDAQVALRRVAQSTQSGLVAWAVVGSDRLGEAVKFDQYGTLLDAALICLSGDTASEKAPTTRKDRRNSQFCVCFTCCGVGDRAIANDPICLLLVMSKTTTLAGEH